MPCVLGLDIGTTSTIAILIDTDGRTLALASRPVTLSSLHPGWAEEDPEHWWRNVCALIPAVLDQARVPAINALEPAVQALSDEALANQTVLFRERLAKGESLDDLLPEAFATPCGTTVVWSNVLRKRFAYRSKRKQLTKQEV